MAAGGQGPCEASEDAPGPGRGDSCPTSRGTTHPEVFALTRLIVFVDFTSRRKENR